MINKTIVIGNCYLEQYKTKYIFNNEYDLGLINI